MEDQRYPISVRLIGVMHKEKSKMYMTSVLWSDQNDIVIYRTFVDFKKMHKQLKKAFPPASKLKKSDRIIPTFRYRNVTRGNRRKDPTNSLLHLKFLQKYCNDLLSCDPRVCQSADLIQFFHPKDQDMEPDFAKNSIIIMPSEDEVGANARHVSGHVTQPFVTETYRCVAPYDTKDTRNKPFKVKMDEKLDVLIKDKGGWWLVENEDKRMAWFPAPYLEKLDDDDGDEDELDGPPERGMMYTAVKSYKATKQDEITVCIGAVVEVLQQSQNGWWLIRYNGKAGYIPSMYLQPYNYPHIRMQALHDVRRASSSLLVPTPSLQQQSQHLSRSQGNLQQVPPVLFSSPRQHQPASRQRSHSFSFPSEQAPAPGTAAPAGSPPAAAKRAPPPPPPPPPPPTITVEADGDEEQRGRGLAAGSKGSLSSDSSDFSLSDELNSSSASSTFNLSYSANDDRLRLNRTPTPAATNSLSPTSGLEGKMIPSVSDPNIYKTTTTPQVPPRPRAQEILTRCTTVTRKKATKGAQTEILSR